jgi:hypothetical protein
VRFAGGYGSNRRIAAVERLLSMIATADPARRRSEQQEFEVLFLNPEALRDIGASPSWFARTEILRQDIRSQLRGF